MLPGDFTVHATPRTMVFTLCLCEGVKLAGIRFESWLSCSTVIRRLCKLTRVRAACREYVHYRDRFQSQCLRATRLFDACMPQIAVGLLRL